MGVYWVTLACLILISHNSITVEGKPGLLHHHNHHTSNYGAVAGSSDPAFSASSYDSLGIQPTRSGRNQYWWQGPQSPFGEGVAQNQGISSGSSSGRPQQTVIGCSGNGCDSPLFSGPAVASSSSSSFSGGGGGHSGSSYGNSGSGGGGGGGGSCCNFFWQKPGHPCSTHQGNDCPRGFSCVNYRSCSNGVISSHASSGYASKRPSTSELMSFGRPCGSSGTEVCCEDAPSRPQQPVVQQPSYTYYPPAAPAPPQQPVVQQPPNTYFPPTPAAPATTPRPVYNPPPVTYTPAPPAYQPPPPPVYTPSPPAYKPPPPPVYTTAPPVYQPPPPPVFTTPVYRPTTTRPRPPPPPPPTQPSVAQGPPANLLPYPGCAAALKCVPEEYCSVDGIMINTPVFLTEQQKEFRVPLMACLNIDTNQVGFCCRDPLYNDPWPADMPMPNMPAKPPPTVQPVVVQTTAPPPPPPPPTQPPFIYCYSSQDCVLPEVCSARQQPFNNQPNARCETFTGQAGVCCNRPPPTTTTTTTPPPPPPPTTQPVVIAPPPDSYLPPPPPQPVVNVPDLSYLPPPPPEPVVAPSDTYLPPPLPTKPPVEVLPPPPPSPTQQPVIEQSYIPPPPPPTPQPVIEQSYIPPPPPPQQPVIEQSYIPPPPPAAASQVLEPQCGVSRPVSHQMLGIGEAALGEMPWHAMIAHANGTMTCSGALIGQKFVATSHHCVHGANPASLRVRLGEQRAGANDEPLPHYEIPVMAIIGHPEFEDGALFHDVAVLALAAPAPSGQAHIAPICLPSQNEPQGSQCVVSGWGHDTLSGLQIGMLNRIQVDLVRNNDCQTSLQTTHLGKYFKLHKSFTCASTQHSINPCKVDGGSPLACKRPDGSHVLIGLSSWSVGCSNQQQPGVYADVAAVAPWMQQQMSQPEASLVEQSNSAFHQQQQTQQQQHFPSNSGLVASYGR